MSKKLLDTRDGSELPATYLNCSITYNSKIAIIEAREIVFVRLESNVPLDKEKNVTKKTWPPNAHVFFI